MVFYESLGTLNVRDVRPRVIPLCNPIRVCAPILVLGHMHDLAVFDYQIHLALVPSITLFRTHFIDR
jgi:hypothetical protein